MSESRIFLTSDTHFGHDKDFVWEKRGFRSVDEMNEAIVRNWNEVVKPGDTVYHLGDVYLGGDENIKYVERLAGRIHIIAGNHDSNTRREALRALSNVKSVSEGETLKYEKRIFYLSHYPTLTCDVTLSAENINKGLHNRVLNLYGHTHQTSPYFNREIPYVYNVGMDAHECRPVSIDDIIDDIRNQHEVLRKRAEKIFKLEEEIHTALEVPVKDFVVALEDNDAAWDKQANIWFTVTMMTERMTQWQAIGVFHDSGLDGASAEYLRVLNKERILSLLAGPEPLLESTRADLLTLLGYTI